MMAEDETVLRLWRYLQIVLYTCLLIKVSRPHIDNPLLYAAKQSKFNQSKHRVKLRRLSLKSLHCKAVKVVGGEPDVNAVVLINKKKAVSLGLRCGEWQNILCHFEDTTKTDVSPDVVKHVLRRWIMIVVCPDITEDHCFVSPLLYHNLQQGNCNRDPVIEFENSAVTVLSDAVQRILALWKDVHETKTVTENKNNMQNSPDIATEVHVQLVESTYKCGSEVELLLKDYFKIPKVVATGDILVVPIPNHLGHEFVSNTSIIPPKYVFIKISGAKVRCGSETKQSVIVTEGVTSLYLAGTTHCCLPSLNLNFDDRGNVDVPPILKRPFDKLKNILQMEMEERRQCLDNIMHNSGVATPQKGNKKDKDKLRITSDILHSKTDTPCTKVKQYNKIRTPEENCGSVGSVSLLLLGPPGCGSEQIIKLAASALGLGVHWTNTWHLKGDTSGGTEARLRQVFLRASAQGPCVLALLNVQCIAKDRDGGKDARVVSALKEEVAKLSQLNPPVLLVATAPDCSSVSDDLWSVWSYQESVQVPDLCQRTNMLVWLLSKWLPSVQTQTLAQRTAGYVLGDFQALVNAACRHCLTRMTTKDDGQAEELPSCGADVENKTDVPLVYADLLKALGVLLYGPPGTGKTLLAKAVATECGLNFMSVKGPELLNMYVGQSEENVRQVFSRARAASPCVIFFDELDSLAPNRGRSGDSGGVMDRIVSALLAELDGVASIADVFVLAATNRPDLIDPALLRPGRFEKLVFLGVCDDRAGQIKILKAVTSKIPLDSSVSLEQIADLLPLTLTGADLYALCTDALYAALHRTTGQIVAGVVQEEAASIVVEEEDFHIAAENLVPSVTPGELAHYRALNTSTQRR
ncbi:peroxisome assembly factor 2-like isoform X2 [Homarus americanus]|uniref:peroxisome assembly factor 2-like isoform X2 n=1 Tax=Homarus americanus TaxID=6706 RepID=UPI001C43A8B8|nr:peroxisome assembly factor 2-like isoform X2 [Homarus americanus]